MQAIFFDRDGTLGESSNIEFPTQFHPFPQIKDIFLFIKSLNIKVFILTNQSCIARGKDNGYDFAREFRAYGADDWFICPHDTGDRCNCRKPATGLLEQAKEKYNLDLSDCLVVGDRDTDVLCGKKMGCKTMLVLTGRGKECVDKGFNQYDYVLNSVLDIPAWFRTNYKVSNF